MQALVVNTKVLEKVWEQIDKEEGLWSLYAHTILPLYCCQEGALEKLNNMQIKRSQRNNRGTLDTKAWEGEINIKEPYWSLSSRSIQSEAWINLFWSMKLDFEKINRIYLEILVMHANQIAEYYEVLKSQMYKESILYMKRKDIVDRDLTMKRRQWIKLFFSTNKTIKKIENEHLKTIGKKLKFDKTYYKRLKAEFIKLLK